jgi:DNA-binding beta-propeller fold protein YncE
VRGLLASLFLVATAASAHSIVDIAMSFDAPKFVAAQQSFTYRVIADDQNNDNGSGIVVTIVLPPSVKFSGVSSGNVFRCTESKLTLTCSAEIIPPGPNPISISVIAPAAAGSIHATAHTVSLGSLDLNGNNDNASADIVIYDPAACHAMTPLILGPSDETPQPAVVPLAWSSVDGAQSYIIFTAVEGAAAAPASATAKNNISLAAEPGRSEWWVEANFGNCPPIDSEHRHFTVASTVARNVVTYSGDPNVAATRDGTRSTATFNRPFRLALSPQNEMYVSDEADNVVRKIAGDAVVVVAGSPGGGQAHFDHPTGIALDARGNLFVTDRNSVRRIAPSGLVSTVATGFDAPAGIIVDASDRIFVADSGNHIIRLIEPATAPPPAPAARRRAVH